MRIPTRPVRVRAWLACAVVAVLVGCGGPGDDVPPVDASAARGPEWDEPSHGNVAPDADAAFPAQARTVRVTMTEEAWTTVRAQMEEYCNAFGSGMGRCTGGDGPLDMVPDEAQAWVPVTLEADGHTWRHVGLRLKGNSSLTSAWGSGSYALPFRLTMDKFEADEPSIDDQRFYGFQKLALSNNSRDASGVRELLAGAVFEDAGVPVSRSSPAQVTLVIGDQVVSEALYTLVEIPDEPLLTRVFGDDDGALYKPESTLASYVADEFADDDVDDYGPAEGFIAALTDELRTSDPGAWRLELETRFDVDGFLRYLAVNTALLNWDAYGQMAHNYYLYDFDGQLQWIAWDLGLSFSAAGGGPGGGPGGGLSTTSIWYESTDATWPLIRYLLDDPIYCQAYADTTAELLDGALSATVLEGHLASAEAAVTGYATGELGVDLAARVDVLAASLGERDARCP
jgi:spore coat protein H